MKNKGLKLRLHSEALIENQRTDKELPRQEIAKGVHHHQVRITGNIRGTSFRRKKYVSKI